MSAGLLIRLLQNAGHDVAFPAGVGMLGGSDPFQLTFAIQQSRVCLTANYDDFEELHRLVLHRTASTQASWWYAKATIPLAI